MYWTPPPSQLKETNIDSLKRTLATYIDPNWNGFSDSWVVDSDIIPFLNGIIAGNGSGDMAREAKSLIEGIEKYGQVQVIIHS